MAKQQPDVNEVLQQEAPELFEKQKFLFLFNQARRFLYHKLGSVSEEDIEDTIMNALCLSFEKLDSFRGESSYKTWLFKIMYFKYLDVIRRRKPNCSLDEVLSEHSQYCCEDPHSDSMNTFVNENIDTTELTPEEEFLKKELSEVVAKLEQDYLNKTGDTKTNKEILKAYLLYTYVHLPYAEIAKIQKIPINTVKTRIYSVRQFIMQGLKIYLNTI